ncbi:MAG: cyclic nucleotide-binding domain-containing protein [Nitrospirota bacterium]
MPSFTIEHALWALLLGGLSAVSLPMGAMLGVLWKPKAWVTAALTAFGAGALLAALSVELVAPTALAVMGQGASGSNVEVHGGSALVALFALLVGSIVGGILFIVLDQLLNAKGGYLRKTATTITYLSQRRKRRTERMLHRLGQIEFFRNIPPEHVQMLVEYLRPVTFEAGERLFRQGDRGDRMYFLEQGKITLLLDGKEFKALGTGDILGEIALLTGAPRTAEAVAHSHTVAFVLLKEDFDRIRKTLPELEEATTRLASQRLDELRHHQEVAAHAAADWAEKASNALRQSTSLPTPHEIRLAASEHKGAPLAIWLGSLLDGAAESFVIGAGFLAILTAKMAHGMPSFVEVIPYMLIVGVFLSNFPEAMSSSIGMKNQDWKAPKILALWVSLMVMAALGSVVGYSVGAEVGHIVIAGIEGVAAGAMLTMIAQTMIPEAVHLGGPNIVGLSTLAGFLSAVAFKILES